MSTAIDQFMNFLAALGFVDVVLPLIIVFTLVYAIFERTKVFGIEQGHRAHKVNAVVAMIVGLLVVGSSQLVGVTTVIVQYAGLLAIVVLAIAMVLGLFGIEHLPENKWWNAVFFILFMVVSVSIFRAVGWFGRGNDSFIIIFVVFFLIVFFMVVWRKKTAQAPAAQLPNPQTRQQPSPRGAVQPSKQSLAQHAAPQPRQSIPEETGGVEESLFDEEVPFR